MPSSNQIVPCNQKHAIEESVFVIKFATPLRPDHIQKIFSLKDTSEIQSEFPSIKQRVGQKFGLKIEQKKPPKIVETGDTSDLAGIRFERFRTNGTLEKVLQIEGDHISYHCFEYTRWAEVWLDAKRFLKAAAFFVDDIKVAVIALNVRDRFDFDGSAKDFDPADFFIEDSPYLVKNIFELRDLWHCHHGFFETIEIPYVDRELLVTNISTELATVNKLNIRINCFFEARIKPPGVKTEALFYDDKLVEEIMGDLHNKNKKILIQIIKPEIAKKLSLKV